ncbi:secretion/DNA translocation related CpaE-like protein [Kribbella aluminosa]|uniref:Secretion/DNA translocation related CpaE-like protein n=1 Tax=Kribbella aluminosa TaxID=416017 RepID=A0ABS4URX9_9ACTN|nr:septum site-determining protein Ssd [Kribbella aluminosa]MBP2354397.1 secretion/DNA translocation related CpaE-like protein [Kribbella aluminosa]
MDTNPPPPSVLMATTNEALLEDLLRLAAAASVTPHVERDLRALRRNWHAGSLVVIGRDLAEPLARVQPPHRPGVVVVGSIPDGDDLYRAAFDIGADLVCRLPADEPLLAGRLADALDGTTRAALTLAFVGGCGGAGSTTLAVAVAVLGNRRGFRTMLIDGDPLGGGIELALGIERDPGDRWPKLLNASGRVSAAALRSALPSVDGLTVLSWDQSDVTVLPPDTMSSVIGAAQRSTDLVVLDLPRRADPAVEEGFVRSTATLLVVPCDVRSVAAAKRLSGPLRSVAGDVRVVARDSRPGLAPTDVAAHLCLPLATKLGIDPKVPAAMDEGRFAPHRRSPLTRAAADILNLFDLVSLEPV